MNNKFFSILLFALALIAFSACETFDVSNENPDVATSIDNNPELLLTGIERDAVNRMVGASWSEGNLMAQYGARIVFTSFDLFDWGDQSGAWDRLYLSIRDAKALEEIAINNSNGSYEAVSLILQSWMFQILTDMWGDVPFSSAALANAEEPVFGPAYDAQEDIYNSLLENLKRANTLLTGDNLPSIKGDIIFDGDLAKWRKFANSLRLRVAMRLSEINDATAKAEITDVFTNAAQYPVMESNEDNATLVYLSSFPNAHPISEANRYRVGSYNEYRISETLEGILRDYNDPRLDFFADPTANSVSEGNPMISGMQNGIVDGPAYEYKGGDAFLSKFNIDFFHFQPNSNEGRLMTYSEVAFIFAEAAQRGWITGNAETFYNAGVTANFDYWNVDMPADYLTATASFDNTLEIIANQKYIALFYIDFQGFIEFKRTGFPTTIQPGPDAFYSTYPSRFEYPSREQALNVESYNAAIARQGADEITTPVWWENK
ncbi:MAG: SusD/RagB family nutrient-binding outer membrane lipoprotein [Saprospiraceae bacterium]|nr:SusD/RagB family nutrient-binding outer membrane lipoprotein [Saprospiraceae bacterium]